MSLIYSVQSFSLVKGGVRPDIPCPSSNAESAIRSAERQAARAAGAVAVCSAINMNGEVCGVEVLAVFGELPDYIIDSLAGSFND